MDPKKVLIRPEKTASADEKKAAQEKALQQFYEEAERFLKELKDNPTEFEGGLFQLCKELLEKFPDIMALKITDEPRTEEERASIRKQQSTFKEFVKTRMREVMSTEDSDVKEGIAAGVRRIMPSKYSNLTESALHSLNVVETSEKDDTEKENA